MAGTLEELLQAASRLVSAAATNLRPVLEALAIGAVICHFRRPGAGEDDAVRPVG